MNNVKKYVIIISMIFFVVIGIVLIRNAFLLNIKWIIIVICWRMIMEKLPMI